MLTGEHINGSWALYLGTSKNVYNRLREHPCTVLSKAFAVGREMQLANPYTAHRVLSEPGWKVHYQCLTLFLNKDYFLFAYLSEAAMCFIFGSLDKSYTDKSSSTLARLIPDLNDGLF